MKMMQKARLFESLNVGQQGQQEFHKNTQSDGRLSLLVNGR